MASKMATQHLEKLRDELAKVTGDIRALEGRREGLLMAIAVLSDQPPAMTEALEAAKKPRGPMKEIVLRFLSENAERGLIATELVELAKAQGTELDRNSVSSLLSRFKRDGIVEHTDGKYRIPRPFLREVKGVA